MSLTDGPASSQVFAVLTEVSAAPGETVGRLRLSFRPARRTAASHVGGASPSGHDTH